LPFPPALALIFRLIYQTVGLKEHPDDHPESNCEAHGKCAEAGKKYQLHDERLTDHSQPQESRRKVIELDGSA
jgi:hypothetical protein